MFRSQSIVPGVVKPVTPTRTPPRTNTACEEKRGAPDGCASTLALTTRKVARRIDSWRKGTPKLKSWLPGVAASYPSWFITSTIGFGSRGATWA